MKVKYDVKYGQNEIEFPCPELTPKLAAYGTNQFVGKITIYNDIASDGVNSRRFDRHIIDKCLVYNRLSETANGTIQTIVNAQNVVTKDIEHYKPPTEYKRLAADEKEHFYTVQIDDYVVLEEVEDVVTTPKEFQELQKKYKTNGFSVTGCNESGKGMAVHNIHIMHA